MTPRERVESVLLGRGADQVPFTAYFNKLSLSRVERELRNAGLCVVESYYRVNPFTVETPHVSERSVHYPGEDGIMRVRTVLETPRGSLSAVDRKPPDYPRIPGQFVPWHEEYLFKGPEDYAAIESMIRDRRYVANYEAFRQAQNEAGQTVSQGPMLARLGSSRVQENTGEIQEQRHKQARLAVIAETHQ